MLILLFFFNDTATTEIYTLSLHDALPISSGLHVQHMVDVVVPLRCVGAGPAVVRPLQSVRLVLLVLEDEMNVALSPDRLDRKSTRLNSSHANISYAVFCLKKKNHTSELFF